MYLRDEAEKQRHAELELRDQEVSQFAALKAKVERQEKQKKDAMATVPLKSTKRSLLPGRLKIKPKSKLDTAKRKRKSEEDAPSTKITKKEPKSDTTDACKAPL